VRLGNAPQFDDGNCGVVGHGAAHQKGRNPPPGNPPWLPRKLLFWLLVGWVVATGLVSRRPTTTCSPSSRPSSTWPCTRSVTPMTTWRGSSVLPSACNTITVPRRVCCRPPAMPLPPPPKPGPPKPPPPPKPPRPP